LQEKNQLGRAVKVKKKSKKGKKKPLPLFLPIEKGVATAFSKGGKKKKKTRRTKKNGTPRRSPPSIFVERERIPFLSKREGGRKEIEKKEGIVQVIGFANNHLFRLKENQPCDGGEGGTKGKSPVQKALVRQRGKRDFANISLFKP